MHADHVLGLVAILTMIMSGMGMTAGALDRLKEEGIRKKVSMAIISDEGVEVDVNGRLMRR